MKDLPTPFWLEEPFLIRVLEQEANLIEKVKIIKWSSQPAIPYNSNSLNELYRVFVDYRILNEDNSCSEHSTSIIVKLPKDCLPLTDLLDAASLHAREMTVYQSYMPITYNLHWSRPNPKPFICPFDNLLILEDLEAQGYRMADRLKQLDVAHCRETLIALAKFHAISVGVCRHIPELTEPAEEEDEEYFTYEMSRIQKFSKSCLSTILDTAKNLESCQRYIEGIEEKIRILPETIAELSNPARGLKVLSHGDVWTNNILFKYDASGDIVDAKLVDLQQSQIDSFAYDLILFWWSSANEHVRECHREELFREYRLTFNETLLDIGIRDTLTKDRMEQEINMFAPFALHVISYKLVVAMSDPEDPVDYRQFCEDVAGDPSDEVLAELRLKCSDSYKQMLPTVLRQAEEFGVFRQR